MDVGDGATGGKRDGEIGGSDLHREFRDGEDVKGALCEEAIAKRAAEAFDGAADSVKAIEGIMKEAFASIRCVTYLVAVEGHSSPLSGGGGQRGQVAPGGWACQDEDEEKKRIVEFRRVQRVGSFWES